MTHLELETNKMELIRAIANIKSDTVLANVKERLNDILKRNVSTETDSKQLTERMIKKFAGKWKDNRSSDEIISDIYNSRISNKESIINPFDE
ncbi:MAG: hypothetical protein LBL97_09080 [Prevotellaceae bacterium]|jgi:ribonuclease HI|nr:hypothetical protein [Prevotellaceae bacterium]